MDESELTSKEGKVAKCTILHHCSQIMKQYFDQNSEADKCQLFLALIKSRSMETARKKLGIRTLKNIESSNHIVKSLTTEFTSIGKKNHSQDCPLNNGPRLSSPLQPASISVALSSSASTSGIC